jgi:hypothetical protein
MVFYKKNNRTYQFNNNKSLTELANAYETDKGDSDPRLLSWGKEFQNHLSWGYTKTYEKYMEKSRTSDVKLFEVGIRDKRFPYGSSKMWLNYFKNVDLYGMDNFWGDRILDKRDEIDYINNIGVNFVYADQGNFNDWEDLKQVCPSDFDFFIEDGSHWPNHMIVTLWQSIDMVKSGGYYFMEDLQNPITSRGMYRYDNTILTEELLISSTTKKLNSMLLNDKQNLEVNAAYELVEMVLDKSALTYLAVFRKK